MKQRVISAAVALAIFIPIFIIGSITFNVAVYVLTILGLREFINVRQKEKNVPDFIKLISYLMISLYYFSNTLDGSLNFTIDYRLVAGLFLTLFIPVVFYHDDDIYGIKDAFYLLGGVFFLGSSMSLFSMYRNLGMKLIIFLFLITIMTDSFAYFCGRLIGKNKLLESISPNKTWEGTICGSIVGTFICTIYYVTVINSQVNLCEIVGIIFFLSLIGQFGDLFFSAIKRRYKIKDFSNIMPGHGGVLDRLDSIIFVMLTFTFFLEIL